MFQSGLCLNDKAIVDTFRDGSTFQNVVTGIGTATKYVFNVNKKSFRVSP